MFRSSGKRHLADFVDVSWDGTKCNATLSQDCPFIGQPDKTHAVIKDITGSRRSRRPAAGTFDTPQSHACVHYLRLDGVMFYNE